VPHGGEDEILDGRAMRGLDGLFSFAPAAVEDGIGGGDLG
jgi:hypothetical protein